MPFGLSRANLQIIAQNKLDDARLLIQARRFANGYYLTGYAVEIGLKACIAAQVSAETIPDKAFLRNVLSHQFGVLIGLAGLANRLQQMLDANSAFAANWALASQWSPDVRYDIADATTAEMMYAAVADDQAGIFRWIKAYW